MTDIQLLIVVFLALCLLQSVRIVPADMVILQKGLLRHWRMTRPLFRFGTGRLALVWLDPLALSGSALAVRPIPFALSPQGIVGIPPEESQVGDSNSPAAISRDLVQQIRSVDTDLVIGNQRFMTCLHAGHAKQMAEQLRELNEQDSSVNSESIIRRWFDESAFRQTFDHSRDTTLVLRYCSLCFFLAVIAFLVHWDRAGFQIASWALYPVVFFWIFSVILLWRAHRTLFPQYVGARLIAICEAIFYPISIICAADSLVLPAVELYHPVTAAIALGQSNIIISASAEALRKLRFPIRSRANDDPFTEAVTAYARQSVSGELESLLARNRRNAEEILEKTLPREAGSAYYCPRCLSGYLEAVSECPDCPGVLLLENKRK